jgi:hypothetical protein
MTCTERAKDMGLWEEATDEERKPSNQLQLHDILHEILAERYGGMPDESADKIFTTMNIGEYRLLWVEALRRFRKRKQLMLQEQQVYS